MPRSTDFRRIAQITTPRDGVAHRRDLLEADLKSSTIDRVRDRGQLVKVFPAVYLAAGTPLTQRRFLRACALHAGPEAWPLGRSSLELRRVLPPKSGFARFLTTRELDEPIRTLIPLEDGRTGILETKFVRKAATVRSDLVDGFDAVELTASLADLAAEEGSGVLARAWREATFLCLLDARAIERELDRVRRPGRPAVRERLRNAPPVTRPGMDVRSRTGELAFLELVRELGLPEPLVNVPMTLAGHRWVPDFRWVLLGLVVETDGGQHDAEWHRLADEERDAALEAAGLVVFHVRNAELTVDRSGVAARFLSTFRARAQEVSQTQLWTPDSA